MKIIHSKHNLIVQNTFFRIHFLVLILLNLISISASKAQSMVVESLTGPVTRNEIEAFKTYVAQKFSFLKKGVETSRSSVMPVKP